MCTGELLALFTHVDNLDYDEEPDYKYLKRTFEKVVTDLGSRVGGPLDFTNGKTTKVSSSDDSSIPAKKARARPAKSDKKVS